MPTGPMWPAIKKKTADRKTNCNLVAIHTKKIGNDIWIAKNCLTCKKKIALSATWWPLQGRPDSATCQQYSAPNQKRVTRPNRTKTQPPSIRLIGISQSHRRRRPGRRLGFCSIHESLVFRKPFWKFIHTISWVSLVSRMIHMWDFQDPIQQQLGHSVIWPKI